jgi:hypothetical protein
MGGGVSAELLTFGQTKVVTFSGYFNPEKLVQNLIDRVVDFAGDELKKFYEAAGKTVTAAGKKSIEMVGRAGKFVREWAGKGVAGARHSIHGFDKCYNHCVVDYANPKRHHLLKESNAAVQAFCDDIMSDLLLIEGDSPAETRRLRLQVFEASWKELFREIDKEWDDLHGDRGVIPFFGRPSNATKGRIKFQALVNESRDEHRRFSGGLFTKLVTEKLAAAGESSVPTGRYFFIKSAQAGNQNLGYWDQPGTPGQFKQGDNLGLWALDRGVDQQFTFVPAGGEWYYIRARNGGFVDVAGGNNGDGVNIHIWSPNQSVSQKFKLQQAGAGRWKIVTTWGRVLCTPRNFSNGANVHTWSAHDGPWTEWRLIEAQ